MKEPQMNYLTDFRVYSAAYLYLLTLSLFIADAWWVAIPMGTVACAAIFNLTMHAIGRKTEEQIRHWYV